MDTDTITITCTIGRTINMGNYNSLRLEWTETATAPTSRFNSEQEYEDFCGGLRATVMKHLAQMEKELRP